MCVISGSASTPLFSDRISPILNTLPTGGFQRRAEDRGPLWDLQADVKGVWWVMAASTCFTFVLHVSFCECVTCSKEQVTWFIVPSMPAFRSKFELPAAVLVSVEGAVFPHRMQTNEAGESALWDVTSGEGGWRYQALAHWGEMEINSQWRQGSVIEWEANSFVWQLHVV